MANDISGWGEQWGEQDQQLTAGAFLSQAQRAHAVLCEGARKVAWNWQPLRWSCGVC
jgi:hypothetical protein